MLSPERAGAPPSDEAPPRAALPLEGAPAARPQQNSPDSLPAASESFATLGGSPKKGNAVPSVPGYDVIRVIGRGGMGVVWEAIEHRLERHVALKVHAGGSGPSPERVAQLWSEARLAAKIAHPGVVAVHDVGHAVDGSPYYTMDLVEGTPLKAILKEGILPQPRALALTADIADAVAAAHDRGVVHCDLKPANILVDTGGHVRILDFGLAVRVGDEGAEGSEQTAVIRGSPPYLSPEQAAGCPPTTGSDVYAIGVILYEMVTGHAPFSAETFNELIYTILFDPPEPPTKHNPAIHTDIERVILRCLAKKPEDRLPSARVLADALSALAEGRPLDEALSKGYAPRPLALAPRRTKPSRDQATIHYRWTWKLRTPPSRLWPFVSNTERINKAIGLPNVSFVDEPDPRGGTTRTGRFRLFGLSVLWDEHPFEWSKGREHSVFRSYKSGPLSALWNRVELLPGEDGGTELVHEIWANPKGLFGLIAAFFEIRVKAGTRFDQVYKKLDASLQGGSSIHADPFEEPHRPSASQRERVETGARRLVHDDRFPEALVSELAVHLLHSPSKSLERLRPYALADLWGYKRPEVLDLFLHGASAGMVDIAWDLICPECSSPHETARELARVTRTGNCTSCTATFDRDLAASVELVFRPHREVRDVHHTTYCAGSPALRPHVLLQQVLDPGEERVIALDLVRGEYRLAGQRFSTTWEFSASAAGFSSECEIALDPEGLTARPSVLKAGEVRFKLQNGTDTEHVFRVEVIGERSDSVTAAMAMSHPAFHDFFSDELVAHGEHLAVSRMAFLFVDVEDRAELLKDLGDPAAFSLFHKLSELFERVVRSSQGAIVDVTLDPSSAAFSTSRLAVQAALALQEEAAAAGITAPLRAAVHEGRCIAVTRAGRIDYFGDTVHRAAALLDESPSGGVALSSVAADHHGVAMALHGADLVEEVVTQRSGPYKGRRVTRVTRRVAELPRAAGD